MTFFLTKNPRRRAVGEEKIKKRKKNGGQFEQAKTNLSGHTQQKTTAATRNKNKTQKVAEQKFYN